MALTPRRRLGRCPGRRPGEDRSCASSPHSAYKREVLGDRAFSSWYSNGIVAIDLSDPTQPQQVGQFVPDTSKRHANSLGTGPAEVWGVAIDPETGIVYASDMRTGLWIVQPTGAAASLE